MLEILKATNLGLRFLLELIALGALGYWGFRTGQSALLRWVLGLGTPLLAAVVWGNFIAPKAPFQVPGLDLLVFGLAAAGLYAAGRAELAAIYGLVVGVNKLLMLLWKQ